MMRFAFTCFWLVSVLCVNGQTPSYLELAKAESRLQSLFELLYSDTLSNAGDVLDSIHGVMGEALLLDGAMEYPWDRLDRIGVRNSEDGAIRVFTWHVADHPDRYRYFGFIQSSNRRGRINVSRLEDNLKPQRAGYRVEQSAGNWYGKLYYQIVTKKVRRTTVYTLLGMDFNDSKSNIKTVEVISLHRNKPRFERERFFNGRDRVDRVVLEYSDQVAISVRYNPRLDMITYDHLVPLHPLYENQYEFYGPDGTFDGLEFSGDSWVLVRDIDARLED